MAKILVVDDSPVNRELIAAVLRRGQHQVLEAADGAEALKRVRADRPHLVICDILMPTMDGYEFVRRVRADRDVARTLVIFCTATFLEREARHLAESCGVLRVLTKPIDLKTFPKIIEHAIAQHSSHSPDTLEDTRAFDREHIRLVNEKLIERGADLEIANRRLSALTDLNLSLASERDPNQLLDQVCRGARELIGARFSALGVRDLTSGECIRLSTWGLPPDEVSRLGRPLIDSGVFAQIMRESRPKRLINPGGNPTSMDALKIDREFVRDCTCDPDDAAIAQSIVSLAHNLGLHVVAEGVETQEQLEFLASVGCDEMQGYYFSRPVSQAYCTQMLAEGRRMTVPVLNAKATNEG